MTLKFQSSIGSKLFEKVEKVEKWCCFCESFSKFPKNKIRRETRKARTGEGRSCSTSYQSGKQVDGLPLVAIASWKCLWITIVYLSYILTLRAAIGKPRIARAISEFYLLQVFLKVEILMFFFENFQISRKTQYFEK